ncbi:MAG TPA: hypothetical protein VMU67_10280 [Steroidobacteraceae bacterium]|nr:hypothetical protein [Steroidobacteraceae bacterium]
MERCIPLRRAAPAIAALAFLAPVAHARAAVAPACDRRCLLEMLWVYTEALTDDDPSRLPRAPGLRVTSNGAVVALGHGAVWGSPRRIPFREALVDPATGAALFYGVVTNAVRARGASAAAARAANETWWFYALRLKVVGRRVSEIEEIAYPGSAMGANAAALRLPDRIFDAVLPPAERSGRRELIAVANAYFDAVSGKLPYRAVPWHPDCERIELGVFTVNSLTSPGSCAGEFENPAVRWNVVNRRFYLTDLDRGLVLAIANFTTPPDLPHNNGSVVFELFKVQDGLIRQIQAFFRGNGQLHSGWGSGPGS